MTAAVFAAEKFWILDPLYAALGTLLAWFYSVVPSYAGAIVMLTLAVRLATFPLTAKQARSQQDLQRLQPELKRLQAKYKHDRQKLNEEMMKFYKENHVNPFGGCLPILVQFPVLIVLYRLILGLTEKPPKHLPTSSSLYQALQESGGRMVSWGMDLAEKASSAKGSDQIPFLILIALVIATGYYQQRQLTARLPKESRNSQMAMMGKIFPLMFGLISWSIPAGVVVYFLVSNLWQIGQQAVMFRSQQRGGAAATKETAKDGGGSKEGAKGKDAGATKGATAKKGAPTPKRTAGGKAAGKGAKAKGRQSSPSARTAKPAPGAKGAKGGAAPKGAAPKGSAAKGAAPKDGAAKGGKAATSKKGGIRAGGSIAGSGTASPSSEGKSRSGAGRGGRAAVEAGGADRAGPAGDDGVGRPSLRGWWTRKKTLSGNGSTVSVDVDSESDSPEPEPQPPATSGPAPVSEGQKDDE